MSSGNKLENDPNPNPEWQKKIDQTPFGRVSFTISSTEVHYRFLSEDAVNDFEKKLKLASQLFWEDEFSVFSQSFFPENGHALGLLQKDFERFSTRLITANQISDPHSFIIAGLPFELLEAPIRHDGGNIIFEDPSYFLADFKEMPRSDWVVKTTSAQKLFRVLDRQKAKLSDHQRISRSFNAYANHKFPDELTQDDLPEFSRYVKTAKLRTNFQVATFLFSQYLSWIGFETKGSELTKAKSFAEAADIVRKMALTDEIVQREKEYAEKIKLADLSEKKKLSFYLSEFKTARKKLRQLELGLIAFFDSPGNYAQGIEKIFSELEDFLILGRGASKENSLLALDARWDPKLDKNPGLISGDCTENHSLPFDRPEVPIYNVKVYDSKNEHAGNIYLLVTHLQSDPSKIVWHLDALQLPRLEVDADELIENIFTIISQEASKKGIYFITVNWFEEKISNYDYIREAVLKYWHKSGKKKANLETVSFDINEGRYSQPQMDSKVRVVWRQRS